MTYTVVIEQHNDHFTVTVPALPGCAVEAATREQAVEAVRNAISERVARTEITTVEAPPESVREGVWAQDAGILADHPAWDAFQEGIREARKEVNAKAV